MSEKVSQVNTSLDGSVYPGDHPAWYVQDAIHTQQSEAQVGQSNAMVALDIRNYNDSFGPAIKSIDTYFASKNLKIDPVRIVDRETLERAYRISGESSGQSDGDKQGEHVFRRSVVVQNEEMGAEFGDAFVLGVGLHEAAHSVFGKGNKIWQTTERTPNNIAIGDPGCAPQGNERITFSTGMYSERCVIFMIASG